jgi:hypothetical protein
MQWRAIGTSKMPKGKKGGKQPGAGRPSTIGATIRITATLDQSTFDKLKSVSTNISEAIRILAARA